MYFPFRGQKIFINKIFKILEVNLKKICTSLKMHDTTAQLPFVLILDQEKRKNEISFCQKDDKKIGIS